MATNWDQHNRQTQRQSPTMKRIISDVAEAYNVKAWHNDADDFTWGCTIERSDGNRLDVTFAVWDSGDADDGVYGIHGNFVLGLVEEGGRIVGNCIPFNYTRNVWADYIDDAEWDLRIRGFDANPIIVIIDEWLAELS